MPGFLSFDKSTMLVFYGEESPKAFLSADPPKHCSKGRGHFIAVHCGALACS